MPFKSDNPIKLTQKATSSKALQVSVSNEDL